MYHDNKKMRSHFHILIIQDICVELRDHIQIYYFVDSNETYQFNFLFMFQDSN